MTTKFCPLCKKVLLEIGDDPEDRDYICQTRINLLGGEGLLGNVSHYEDRSDNQYIIWIALPYKITTSTKDHKSCIYILNNITQLLWKEVATTSEIHPDTPERLAKRIKLLVPFI